MCARSSISVPITDVPGAPAFVDGLINVRGKVVPLADLRRALRHGAEAADRRYPHRRVESTLDGRAGAAGRACAPTRCYEVTEVAAAALQETPKLGMRWRPEFIRCIGKRGDDFMVVLDIDRIFA